MAYSLRSTAAYPSLATASSSPPAQLSLPTAPDMSASDDEDGNEPVTEMMFPPDFRREFLTKWKIDETDYIRELAEERSLNRPVWTTEYTLPTFNNTKEREAYAKSHRQHPLYTSVDFTSQGKFKAPPRYTALSDELVFMVTKTVSQHERGQKWPADFTRGGDIRVARAPKDPAPRIDVHGLPTAPVYKGYYVLLGERAAEATGCWKVASKNNKQLRRGTNRSDWTVGSVVLAADFATMPRTICYQAHDFDGSIIALRALKSTSKNVRDVVARDHNHNCLFVTSDGPRWPFIWQITGYDVRCSADQRASVIPHKLYIDAGIHLNYDAIKQRQYTVNLDPNYNADVHESSDADVDTENSNDDNIDEETSEADHGTKRPPPTDPTIQRKKRALNHPARQPLVTDDVTSTLCEVFRTHFGRVVDNIKLLSILRNRIDDAQDTLSTPEARKIIELHSTIAGMRDDFSTSAMHIEQDVLANIKEDELRPRALDLLYSVAPRQVPDDNAQHQAAEAPSDDHPAIPGLGLLSAPSEF